MAYTTINKPSDYFNTVTYTGNGGTQSVTGVGFQPDWCWIKSRSNPGVYGHETYDVIRGVRNNLSPNSTDAAFTIPTTGFESFDSDGFTVQLSDNYARGLNENNQLQVAWNWLADNTTGSSNTDGTITSTVSANTTSGFSIVKYSGNSTAGATVGHGLGAVPNVRITKRLTNADSWDVYHSGVDVTGDYTLRLNETGAKTNGNNTNNDTAPTSSVFTLGSDAMVNGSSNDYISYCFAEKKGFSKFGSYTGNGNADGTFVYTGFKPAMVIVKVTSTTNNWNIFDNKRSPINDIDKRLFPNLSSAEQTGTASIDFLSNGFKCRNTNDNYNASGATYIYMAFAEQPLVTTGKVPATAR